MRADLFVCSGVLLFGLMTACHGGRPSTDAGADSGVLPDGGVTRPTEDGPFMETGCDVARQTGCPAGEVCLRGVLADGRVGNTCFAGECDAVAQNCPSGSRCAYVLRDNVTARRCVPAGTGTVAEGGACQSLLADAGDFYDTCAPGLSCTDKSTAAGTTFACQRLCYGATQCPASRDCDDVLRFEGSFERPRVCGERGPSCDVLASNCASSRECYPSPGGGVCVTAGTLAQGEACEYVNDCQAGSACVQAEAGKVCRTLCRAPAGAPGCAGSLRCQAIAGASGVGVCAP